MFNRDGISLDIGSQSINIVVGKRKKSDYIISDAFSLDTPKHAYEDGKLTDVETLAENIKGYLHEKKIRCKDLVFTLNSSAIITREIILPVKKSTQLESMINFEISQFLPVDLSQYIIEYKFMEEFMEDGIKKSKVLVVAVPKSIVDGYYDLANIMKLNPSAMDINSNAISKLLLNPTVVNETPFNSLETIATIDVGHNSLNVSVISEGRIGISRMITFGGSEIDRCVAETMQVDIEEAEKIKKTNLDISPEGDVSTAIETAKNSVGFIIDNWVRDVERIVKFYESRNAGKKVAHVYLYGGGADLKGITDHLYKLINIPTSTIEMINNIKLSEKIKDINIKNYLNAIGAISNNR